MYEKHRDSVLMSSSVPKAIFRLIPTTSALSQTLISSLHDGLTRCCRHVSPTRDYEHVENNAVAFLAYQDVGGIEGPQAPPEQDIGKHEAIAGSDVCSNCVDVDVKALFGYGQRRYSPGYFDEVVACRHCPLCRLIVEAVKIKNRRGAQELLQTYQRPFVMLTTINATSPMGSRRGRTFELIVYGLPD